MLFFTQSVTHSFCEPFLNTKMLHLMVCKQGLFFADLIAVIWLYSQCQKVSFFPIFLRKFPISNQKKNMKRNHHFYHGKSWLKTVEYLTLHSLI